MKVFELLGIKPQGELADERILASRYPPADAHGGLGGNPCPRDWATQAAHEAGYSDPVDIEASSGL